MGLTFGAACQEPLDVFALAVGDPVQLKDGGRASSILTGRDVCLPFNVEGVHDDLQHPALGLRPIVQIDHLGSPLEPEGGLGFGCHK